MLSSIQHGQKMHPMQEMYRHAHVEMHVRHMRASVRQWKVLEGALEEYLRTCARSTE